jgi:hypothetical protein
MKDIAEMTQDEKRELNRVLDEWLSRERSIGVELKATYTLITGSDNERERKESI